MDLEMCKRDGLGRSLLAAARRMGRDKLNKLDGKTAFVTGAGSGIGLGIAEALARAGVNLMLCDIDPEALAAAVDCLKRSTAGVDGVVADVSLKSDLKHAAEATLTRFGKVHVLVNNAGVGGGESYGDWTDAGWDWLIGVNLKSVIWGIEIFGPLIEQHGEGGQIVSTASIAGFLSGSSSPYSVTKYGVVALSEALRRELAPRGIGVSVLCPGRVSTGIADFAHAIPDRFRDDLSASLADGALARQRDRLKAMVAGGIDPGFVGELVREAIEEDWPYIFTDTEFESIVDARFAEIRRGFDKIRDRASLR